MELNNLNEETRLYGIKVAGEHVPVEGNKGVVTGLRSILTEKGITSFTLIVDGVALNSTDSLYEDGSELTFAEVGDIVVERNVKGGKE